MSNENLSELSKPVAYLFDHGVMGPGDFKYGTPQMHSTAKDENARPLYSQEYVSALLAELEAKDKRIAELESGNALMTNKRDLWYGKVRDLEGKLATPVRLQSPWVDKVGNRWLLEGTTADVIRAAGFTVEGDEQ